MRNKNNFHTKYRRSPNARIKAALTRGLRKDKISAKMILKFSNQFTNIAIKDSKRLLLDHVQERDYQNGEMGRGDDHLKEFEALRRAHIAVPIKNPTPDRAESEP